MNTKRKASGFFIVEILIVLVIVGVLVAALMPNLSTYVQRAKYTDVMTAVNAIKPAVELCIINNGGVATGCISGALGVPNTVAQGNSASTVVTVASATSVTITGTAITGSGFNGETFILNGTVNGTAPDVNVTWAISSTSSCKGAGFC